VASAVEGRERARPTPSFRIEIVASVGLIDHAGDVPLVIVPIIFAQEALAERLKAVLPERSIVVRKRAELFGACFTPGAVAFVDYDLMDTIDGANLHVPIVGIMDVAPPSALAMTIDALHKYPWLAHVIQAPLLAMDRARAHMSGLLELLSTRGQGTLGANAIGRTAKLARASRRHARFDRMREYLVSQGLSDRLTETLLETAEELVMNALYDAPVEAGYFAQPRSRTEDVDLPADRACEISYGVDINTVFVRVRDPFGALKRSRLIDVLSRCKAQAAELDESRGGAGLGLWRIFSAASAVSVTVAPGSFTEFTVVLGRNDSRRIARPLAVDLYFSSSETDEAGDEYLVDQSITFALRRGGSMSPTPSPTPSD
jgi:hypothetical protein